MLGMRVYARPFAGVELGLSRHSSGAARAAHAAPGRWPTPCWHAPNVEEAERGSDPSNELAGIDLRLAGHSEGGWAWIGHAQLIGEDEADKMPSRRIATAGLQLKQPWRDGRLEWSVEGSDTLLSREFGLGSGRAPAPAYRHGRYVDGYYHDGLPIGAGIGGGGRLFTLGLAWVPACADDCKRVHMAVFDGRVNEQGTEPLNALFGERGALRGLRLELATARAGLDWSVGLSVQRYAPGPRPARCSTEHGRARTGQSRRLSRRAPPRWPAPRARVARGRSSGWRRACAPRRAGVPIARARRAAWAAARCRARPRSPWWARAR